MVPVLLGAAIGLTSIAVLLTALLMARRVALVRQHRVQDELELRSRPLALAIVEEQLLPLERVRAMDRGERRALARLVGRYSTWVQGDAQRSIAAFFEQTGLLDGELRALRSRRSWRRAAAAYTLGDMLSPRAVPALLTALSDQDRAVRAAAVRSLGRLRSDDAVIPLVRALVAARVPRALAAEALLELGERAVPALRELASETQSDVRATALQLLGYVGSSRDAVLVAEHLRDSSAEVRAKACGALTRIGTLQQHDGLRDALADRISFVRVHAAHGLASVGVPEDVPRLLEMARADEFDVARAAAGAAARIDPEAVRAARGPEAGEHIREAADALELAI